MFLKKVGSLLKSGAKLAAVAGAVVAGGPAAGAAAAKLLAKKPAAGVPQDLGQPVAVARIGDAEVVLREAERAAADKGAASAASTVLGLPRAVVAGLAFALVALLLVLVVARRPAAA